MKQPVGSAWPIPSQLCQLLAVRALRLNFLPQLYRCHREGGSSPGGSVWDPAKEAKEDPLEAPEVARSHQFQAGLEQHPLCRP